ncbi:MAG: hypothetical protein R3F43_22455 [bacterium]
MDGAEGYLRLVPLGARPRGRAFPGYLAERVGAQGVTPFHGRWRSWSGRFHTNRDETRACRPATRPMWRAPAGAGIPRCILEWPYPVAAFLAAFNRGKPRAVPTAPTDPELVLVFSAAASGNPYFQAATPALLFALKVVHDGLERRRGRGRLRAASWRTSRPPSGTPNNTDIGLVLALA